METTLYEITFIDGRVFRVFCGNRQQKERLYKTWEKIKDKCNRDGIRVLQNGIHDIKQWEAIISKN